MIRDFTPTKEYCEELEKQVAELKQQLSEKDKEKKDNEGFFSSAKKLREANQKIEALKQQYQDLFNEKLTQINALKDQNARLVSAKDSIELNAKKASASKQAELENELKKKDDTIKELMQKLQTLRQRLETAEKLDRDYPEYRIFRTTKETGGLFQIPDKDTVTHQINELAAKGFVVQQFETMATGMGKELIILMVKHPTKQEESE